MIPGPDQVVACPNCNALAKYVTLQSGNNFGAQYWTDGKRTAPMLPDPPPVVRCRRCAACYWLLDAKEVAKLPNGEWLAAQDVEEPSEEDYYKAIDEGLAANSAQEKELRILAWQRRNDAFRDVADKQATDAATGSAKFRSNLLALACLLEEGSEEDCLLKGELLRELGEFESAKRVISRVTSSNFATIVRQLGALCDAGDSHVAELQLRG